MEYKSKDRNGNLYISKESKTVGFFYGTFLGRVFIKLFAFPIFSKIIGFVLNTSFSKVFINGFVKKNNIDLNKYEDRKYNSFNDFFTRKLRDDSKICEDKNILISPCDSKLTCYEIDDKCQYRIKDSLYSVKDLLDGNDIYKDYLGGLMLVFRLSADDYHRYIYIDNGKKEKNTFIPGVLNTVRPIVLDYVNIYKKNSREYSILHTLNFGDVIQVEVGAVLVGKINNFHQGYEFVKGEEKGMFEFGGSTIVLLLKKDVVLIDKDILENSKNNIETIVEVGSKIGSLRSNK